MAGKERREDERPPCAYPPIGDYAVIGDTRTAALVSRDGSLDWLCLPVFHSPSVFAAILDSERGGRFRVRPADAFEVTRHYVGDTNVLETTFRTSTGVMRLLDLMPVASEAEKRRELWPNHQVLRVLDCREGIVEVEVVCDPRLDYGRAVPTVVDRGVFGFQFERGAPCLRLRSEIPLAPRPDGAGLIGRATLRAGERRHLSLTFNLEEPSVIPPFGEAAERKLEQTLRWWEEWASCCLYEGPYRADVIRSALTLKLMTYAPSGAVVAAPTTSLPEKIGGVRNWDYRYCWLRDASLTLRALFDLGYETEGASFFSWLLDATRLTAPEVGVLYDIHGEPHPTERELDHLEGYAGSRPVRIGNAAGDQLQLDTYGELMDAAYEFVVRGGRMDADTGRLLVGFGETVCERWREPDEGIWEIRAEPRHHTYSKAMCWVTLDRLLRLREAGHLEGCKVPAERFRRERDAIRTEVERHGYNEALGSYVSVFGGDEVDASLLLLSIYGYVPPDSDRIRGTCERVYERLGTGPLLHRYKEPDGLPPGEGAFGIAAFWGVETRARHGDVERAREDFERLCAYANDVGLYAEEVDPETGACLGNFPQAFTHIGLISAALTLAEAEGRPPAGEAGRTARAEADPRGARPAGGGPEQAGEVS